MRNCRGGHVDRCAGSSHCAINGVGSRQRLAAGGQQSGAKLAVPPGNEAKAVRVACESLLVKWTVPA